MDEWISKKELLSKTGISYGQLYRWKRENLIPDAWFVKRAAFTGQETFFPRERILERVNFILENKDRYALRELVEMLSPNPRNRRYPVEALEAIAGQLARDVANALGREDLNHAQALCALTAAEAKARCGLTEEEALCVAQGMLEWGDDIFSDDGQIAVLRWEDALLPILLFSKNSCVPSRGARLLLAMPIGEILSRYVQALNQIDEEENP